MAKSYSWLLERFSPALVTPVGKVEAGVEVNVPDVAIFNKGRVKFATLNGANGKCLVRHNASKISLHKLRLMFANKVRKR